MVRNRPATHKFDATREYTIDYANEADGDDDLADFAADYDDAFDAESHDEDADLWAGYDEGEVVADHLARSNRVVVALPEWLVEDRIGEWEKGVVGTIVDRTGKTVTIEGVAPLSHVTKHLKGAWENADRRENADDLARGEKAWLHKEMKNNRTAAWNWNPYGRDVPNHITVPLSQVEAIFFAHGPLSDNNLLVEAGDGKVAADRRGTVRDGDVVVTPPEHSNNYKTYVRVDYEDKDDAKECGAKWDKRAGSWYVEDEGNVANWVRCMAAKGYTVAVGTAAEDLLANDRDAVDWSQFDGYDGEYTR